MATRWVCPECGKGKMAPERMNQLDPRRYCLLCSGKRSVTRLVERTAPKLEKRKRVASQRMVAKRQIAKEKRLALPWAQRDELVQKEWKRIAKKAKVLNVDLGALTIRRKRIRNTGVSSCGYIRPRIDIGTLAGRARVCEQLCHLIAHAPGGWSTHGDEFRSRLAEIVHEAYGATHEGVPSQDLWRYEQQLRRAIAAKLSGPKPIEPYERCSVQGHDHLKTNRERCTLSVEGSDLLAVQQDVLLMETG